MGYRILEATGPIIKRWLNMKPYRNLPVFCVGKVIRIGSFLILSFLRRTGVRKISKNIPPLPLILGK